MWRKQKAGPILEILLMLSLVMETLKNQILFIRVTASFCVKWRKSGCLKKSSVWSVLLVVTQVCLVTWNILGGAENGVLEWWRLKLKQICKDWFCKSFGITDLGAPAMPFGPHCFSEEISGATWGTLCSVRVWGAIGKCFLLRDKEEEGNIETSVFSARVLANLRSLSPGHDAA